MFHEFENYFKDSTDFFYQYQWLFKYPITKILIENCLNEFPDDWLDILQKLSTEELNKFANGELINENWPSSLISFVNKCKTLNKLPSLKLKSGCCQLPKTFKLGLSEKKQHEIYYLAELINDKCLKHNVRKIVDFGAGLGYIGQLLNYSYGYEVIGLESSLNNIKIAEKRQNLLYPDSLNKVKFFHVKVLTNNNDYSEIESTIKNLTNDKEFCLIGLHACADLSVNASKLFSIIPTAKLLIMVSCCYHKLEETDNETLINFPVSQNLKCITDNDRYKEILRRPFLRLACQEPAKRWDNMSKDLHDKHAFYVLSRAVIELFTHQNNIKLTKCVRKATRKSQCKNFETYLQDTLERYYFNGNKMSDDEEFKSNIKNLWKFNESKLSIVEIYTGLQLLLQAPAESLVLYDRYYWLIEQNYSAEIIAVLSNIISPRCYATVAVK
ncbi:GSCOCG00004796001-RA-CDS [Cotesia congregata]|uniref:Similar to Rrnad1: Protein RRNAD1 (Mus musculus) n=1 Tax=Cotesia congregata TaxID=51543 RepID=A0A8J2MK86_COTCN|nr:GSCOCG00004796001-RA-CDS [Cotesia congregata]CAG5092011.1 Similar to Rrnad1: Protein RRNAD1 (Mus musculus) [Cotesia congregata]